MKKKDEKTIKEEERTVQEKGKGNFRYDGRLYLVRCYLCRPKEGLENYTPLVRSGKCAWCGWEDKPQKK